MGGRKIHLEASRAQKKKDKEDREKPPDRLNFHGGRERFDRNQPQGPGQGWKRDDYRPGRSPSPRRNDRGSRDGFYGRHDRRRSQSPARHSRQGNDSYRRRSPSPHRRASSSTALDIPRRYGIDVPDVQILLLQEVAKEFVNWVQGALLQRGLKVDVMYLSPRFPRDMVVERQVLEGVHAIIDLDYAAQLQGKINIQVFIRTPGTTVQFEQYNMIDPPIAAELVLREKSRSFPPQPHQQPARPGYIPSGNNYGQHYPAEMTATPAPYQQYPPPGAVAPPPAHMAAAPVPAASGPDLSALIGQIDDSTLKTLLASLQPQQQQQQHQQQQAHYGMPAAPPVDMNAILNSLQGVGAAPNMYGATPTSGYAGSNPADAAQHLQSIMKNLKRVAD